LDPVALAVTVAPEMRLPRSSFTLNLMSRGLLLPLGINGLMASTTRLRTGVSEGVTLNVGVRVGVQVCVGASVRVGVRVLVGVRVMVGVGVMVGVLVLVRVGVFVGVLVGMGVKVGTGVRFTVQLLTPVPRPMIVRAD